ncbi:putative phage excisionase [Paraburkholderia dioscoreae]|uniref:Putative phage excisionase n=1 Tax=Paraburkholderia dioscoreae TaxID=2604047 RepID=A0A5Q4ZL65_9BURK|nr:putative phage excisionase [Paraburkholderia dioscoreae]
MRAAEGKRLLMARYVTIAKFCELTGFTPAAVYTRKCKGIWPEGSVWKYEPGTKKILMDIEAYDEWVEKGQGSQSFPTPAMKSPSPTKASASGNASKRSPVLPTLES